MKKDLLSIVKFFSLAIVFLAFSFSANAERRGLKNLTDSSKAGYPRFAPAPFKTGAAYKYRATDFGNALNFDGVNDFVTISATGFTFPNNEWTEEMWIYLPAVPSAQFMGLISSDDMSVWSKRGPFLTISDVNGLHGGFGYGTGQTQHSYGARNVLIIDTWNHVAQTYDGSRLKVYVNGNLVGEVSAPSSVSNANPIKYLSGDQPGVSVRFKGSMDEVRFWKRARTDTEIKSNYNKTVNAADPDLLLYYSFNQGVAGGDNTSISSVTDNTGNFHGSLNNFTLNGTTSNFVGSLALEAPTANAATNITEGSFIANWTAPSGTTVNNYILEVAKDANFISLVPGYETLTVPGGTTSWEVNGLNPDVTYYYRVKAVIGAATSLSSNIISVKTLVLTGLGNALNFDGTNDYVTFSNGGISFPNNQWTEEMWVYVPSSIGADFKSLLVTNTISATTAALRGPSMYVINKTKLHGGYGDGTNWKLYTTSNEVFRLDTWTHITQTFDGTTLKIYVNGILSESFNMPGNSNVNKINYIGSVENAPSTEGFLGNIDEVRIWSRALTADEIKNNYKIPIDQSAVGSLQGLMAYYDFNQGIAEGNNTVIETLIDSKNAYNATLNNFTKDGANSNFVGTLKLTAPVANAASGITLSSFTAGWAMGTGSSPTPNKYFLDVSTDATFADASKFLPGYRNKDVGNVTSIDVTGLNSGTTYYYRLRAGYATPWFHPSVNSNTITVNTLKTNNITIAATDVKVYGDAPYQLAVSSSGTGAYTYTITAGDAVSISNTGQVTVLKAGTATIAVTQAADAVYGHGGPVTQTITVQPKGLTVTATAADKEYNGTDAASVTLSVTGTVYGDIVTATAGGATFDNKNVGIGKPVTVTGITFSGAKASNYVLANTSAVSASITAKPVKIILTANDKKYDGNTSATGSLTVAGVITGDNVTATAGSITFADKNAGTGKTVTATGISLSNNNYMAITPVTSTANITAKPVTVTFKANNKVFDNTTTATGVLTVTDLEAGDAATAIAAAMNFADPGIGTNKPVTATGISINNTNYTPLNTTATSSANISGKSVTVTINQVASKVYDGNTTASATFNITGLAAGETLTVISADVNFADKNAGTGKPVTATNFKLSDVNYSAGNSSATSTGNITAKPVTVTFKANNKAFDNTTTATGVLTVTDLEAGDAATATAAAMNFADPGIGTNKPVTATGISINNTNYTPLNTTATSSANISGKSVTVTINQVASKVYDGNTTASATFNITGLAAGETLTVISADVNFADKNAGTGKPVTATNFKLSDVNYSAGNSSATSTGNITAKPVTVTFKANNKAFDNTTTATGVLTVTDLEAGDAATATATAMNFADPGIGTNKPVTATGISINNTNYTPLNTTATSSANISGKSVTVTINQVASKVYDGNTTASATFNITGLAAGETLTVISADVNFADKNAGTGKPVTATNFKLSDVNYSAGNSSATSTGNITAKPVKIILTANDKKYDGNTSATGSLTVAGVITGDNVTATAGSITFADKNAGTGKTVTATGISLSNNNYMAITPVTSTANITAKPVTVTFKANNKVFDNTTTATGVLTVTDLEAGDAATAIAAAMNFADPSIGTNKPVTATGISINNANYTPLNTTATSSANISGKSVTVTINQVASKVYDGNTTASATFNITGLAAGETVTVISADVTFADKNAGTGKTVTATNFKLSDVNYSAGNSSATSTGNITAKPVTVTFKANNKAFDNTTTATGVLTVTDLEAGDAATATAAAMNFADPGIGTNKPVTATGISINNTNYTPLNTTATSTANISGKSVTVIINQVASKVYDGNTTASATFNISGLAAGETLTVISADVNFVDKNVGTGKPVTATNFKFSDANYSASNSSANYTGNITAKPVKIILTVNDKEYDGSPIAGGMITVSASDLVSGETITATVGSITFADKNAGTDKPVTATGISLSNNNYMAITPVTSTANITAKPVTVTLSANNKPFDGNNTATGALTVVGKIASDDLRAAAGSILFDNANIGTNKPVTASGISLVGSDQGNYRLTNTTATSTANISGKGVTVSINKVAGKVYDGNTTASATFNISGLAAGETLTVISADVSFSDKNVGVGKAVTAGNFKLSDANYSAINTTATSTGNISPKDLTITADNKAKLPGEDNPPLTAGYSGFVSGENNTNALTVQPLLTTPATKASPPGNYPIEVSGAVAANSNYNIVYNKGTLTISTVVITAVTLTTNTLYANSPTGTLAGRLTASSTDPKAIYTYSLVSGAVDNGKFTINGDKLYTNAVFNYATQSTFTVRIQVSTQSGGMLTKDFILTVLYVNGSPTLDAIADQSVCATTDSHTINLSGITPGPEANQTTTLSIAGSNKDMFNALSVTQLSGGKGIINYSLKAGVTGSAVVTVTVKDDGGTADGGVDTYSVSFTVNVNPLPVISISTGTGKLRIIRGRTIELTANGPGATAYSWADAKGIVNGQSTAKLTVKPTERTVYTVKATSTAGCSDVKQITIEVGSEYSDVVANNIITPNGDGVNDVWVIENIEQYPNATVKVFDIAKHLIFSQTNYDNKWNGYFNGKPLHEGTYYYVIDFGTDLYKAKGHITIINEQ